MAAAVAPTLPKGPLPLEYIRIYDLPGLSTLPDDLQGRRLFSRVNFVHGLPSANGHRTAGESAGSSVGQQTNGRALVQEASTGKSSQEKSSAFNYSKALKAALEGAGSSVKIRGDGKTADGQDFALSDAPGGRAKLVHLTPDALAPGNAERTLQQLDRLQQRAGGGAGSSGQQGRTTSTAAAASKAPPPRSGQQQHAAALATAAKALYDIGDDDDDVTAAAAAAPAVAAAAAAVKNAAAPAGGLRVPEHTVRQVAGSGSGAGNEGQLEVTVLLPEVASPGEVEVWLGAGGVLQVAVPGKYHLKLDLPYRVLDDTSQAKWSKAKRRLTLTLTRVRAGQ